jgi:CII-binding regulator of phage lambda lysogenization HflD
MMKHQMGILVEDFNHKLDLVVEGHQILVEKIDATRTELKQDIKNLDQRLMMTEARLDKKIDTLEERLNNKIDTVEENLGNKIDAIAKDLSDHRADTERHAEYKVSEK